MQKRSSIVSALASAMRKAKSGLSAGKLSGGAARASMPSKSMPPLEMLNKSPALGRPPVKPSAFSPENLLRGRGNRPMPRLTAALQQSKAQMASPKFKNNADLRLSAARIRGTATRSGGVLGAARRLRKAFMAKLGR